MLTKFGALLAATGLTIAAAVGHVLPPWAGRCAAIALCVGEMALTVQAIRRRRRRRLL